MNASADAARENSRHADGRFGEQPLADPGTNLLDPDARLAADLTGVLARADKAHTDGDTDTLEELDFEIPELLSALAERYGDDPAFANEIADYRLWRSDFQTQVDADDEGGDVDLSDTAEDIARAFAAKLNAAAPVEPSVYQRWLAEPADQYRFSRALERDTIFSYGYVPRPLQSDTRVSLLYQLAKHLGDQLGAETPLPHLPAAGQLARVERLGEFGMWVAGETDAETWRTVENAEDPALLTNGDYLADVHRRLCTILTGGM